MEISSEITLREARDLFYKYNDLPKDGGISENSWSPTRNRGLRVYLPNFRWRRKAIPYHDLHHIITGYQFCPTGEFQVATWEFAAGKYPNIFTTLFCIPLVSIGAILIPKKQFRAFTRGRRSQTLYSNMYGDELLEKTVFEVKKEILPNHLYTITFRDFFEYIKLVFISGCVTTAPLFLIFIIYIGVE